MRYGFPFKLRLITAQQFRTVFTKGRKASLPNVKIYHTPNKLSYPRLGVIITKRHVAKATERNRLKRVVREFFRLQQEILSGQDIVIVIYKNISNEVLREWLEKFLEKL